MSSPNYPKAFWQIAGNNSNVVDLDSQQLIGFVTPGTFASTAVTILAATTIDGTYKTVKITVAGTALSFTTTTNSWYGFTADIISELQGVRFIKLAGGSSEAAGTTVELCLIPRQST